MIYGTVGTHASDFGRLINALDTIARETGEEVVIQTGLSTTLPVTASHFDFRAREDLLELQRQSRIIVCHAGIGSIIDALKSGRPFVCVPRRKRFREHNTDHQLEIAEAVTNRGWGAAVLDIADLPALCADPPPAKPDYSPAREPLIAAVREFVAPRAR